MLAMQKSFRAPVATRSRTTSVRIMASAKPGSAMARMGLPVATLVATALISGAAFPEDALAAKSSGRVGGSSGFAARKAPARTTTQQSTTVVNNVMVAPPVMAPPIFSPFGFGFGGFSIMPTFLIPIPFSGLFSMFFLLMAAGVIFNVVRSISANSETKKSDKDGWGDL